MLLQNGKVIQTAPTQSGALRFHFKFIELWKHDSFKNGRP